jgi:lysine 6-dehydrogenase
MKMRIVVLGAGRVGSAIAMDLAADRNFEVVSVDINSPTVPEKKREKITFVRQDLSDSSNLQESIKTADLVVNALPGFMGYSIFRQVIEAGKNIVDIAFFAEDPFQSEKLARQRGVMAIMDCGVAPGMSNLLIGYAAKRLDQLDKCEIYVGGLPVIREWPYEYKAVFSPLDVLEEYIRPARFKIGGEIVTRPALSGRELMDFKGIGTLEAFNTDGLRTLLQTVSCPDMIEKTLRYPGHVEKMLLLRETGFFGSQEINVSGNKVRPIDLTAKLLFPKWELKKGEQDLTVMRIVVQGRKGREHLRYSYDLLDHFDVKEGITSMARTTGYTAAMVVRLITAGKYKKSGVSPPEFLGQDVACVRFMLDGLAARGIHYHETIAKISSTGSD